MLFMDLMVNNVQLFSGLAVRGQTLLEPKAYLGFSGGLMFVDTQGFNDPSWDTLNTRYWLIFFSETNIPVQVPLQAVPIQNLTVELDGQVCVIGLYDQEFPSAVPAGCVLPVGADAGYTNQAFLASAGPITVSAPSVGTPLTTYTATATVVGSVASWAWSITNGVILSGQGTSSITYEGSATGSTVLTVQATLTAGGAVIGTASTYMSGAGSTTITAPTYIFAGQFGVVASVPNDPALLYTWTQSGMRAVSGAATSAFTVDAGQASTPESVTVTVVVAATGAVVGSSTASFKVVPYTSTATFTTGTLVSATDPTVGYQDFTMPLGWQYIIQAVQTNYPALIRVYETAAERAADAGRGFTTDPTTDPTLQTVIVFEGETDATTLSFNLEHPVTGTNGDGPRNQNAYIRVYNMDSVSRAITLTVTRTETQVSNSF